MKRSDDRRTFLKLLLTGGIAAAAPISAAAASAGDKKESVTLLTEDGKLVTMDREMLEKIRKNRKASNHDIQDFMSPEKGDSQ